MTNETKVGSTDKEVLDESNGCDKPPKEEKLAKADEENPAEGTLPTEGHWFHAGNTGASRRRLSNVSSLSDPDTILNFDDVAVEETYWVNQRGMSLFTTITLPKDKPIQSLFFGYIQVFLIPHKNALVFCPTEPKEYGQYKRYKGCDQD